MSTYFKKDDRHDFETSERFYPPLLFKTLDYCLGGSSQIEGPGGCCDLRTGVGNVGASATSVRRQRRCMLTIQSSGRGKVGASATSVRRQRR